MFRDTAATTAAVPATKGFPRHAGNAEVFLVEFPQFEELFDCLPLLVVTADFWHISRILYHGDDIEPRCQAIKGEEQEI